MPIVMGLLIAAADILLGITLPEIIPLIHLGILEVHQEMMGITEVTEAMAMIVCVQWPAKAAPPVIVEIMITTIEKILLL